MALNSYTKDIMLKANWEGYDERKPMTFTGKYGSISCGGEGGNRHIYVADENGSIDIWVDLHISSERAKAFVSSIRVFGGKPSAELALWVQSALMYNALRIERGTMYFTDNGLDKFFQQLYDRIVKPL